MTTNQNHKPMKKKTKSKRPGTVVRKERTRCGLWEVYAYTEGKRKQYGTRLIAGNGYLICSNKGFNSVTAALKNIKAVKRAAI